MNVRPAAATGDVSDVRRAVKRYWNRHPISMDSVHNAQDNEAKTEEIYRRWRESGTPRREEFLEMCRGQRVLEVGCGIAVDGRFLSENGVDYQAVDLSYESLRLAAGSFRANRLPWRFANADATQLPFADGTFDVVYSMGVLHHVPDTAGACREVARVLRPGGAVRVMFYHRRSYHYWLVAYVVSPLVWLLLQLPFGAAVARRGPAKFRAMFDISREHGFDKLRLLDISTDTSEVGNDNFNPYSTFYSEADLRAMFAGFEDFDVWKTELKYFPFSWFRRGAERRWGFFLHMTARKPNDPNASPSRQVKRGGELMASPLVGR